MKAKFLTAPIAFLFAASAYAERPRSDRDDLPRNTRNNATPAPAPTNTNPTKESLVIQERLCHTKFASALNQFEFIAGKWFRKENPEFNVALAFDALKGMHKKHLEVIDAFARRPLPAKIETPEMLRLELAKLNTEYENFLYSHRPMVSQDHEFLEKLAPLQKALAISDTNLQMKTEGCTPAIVEKIDGLKKTQNELATQVNALTRYVASAAKKRETALKIVRAGQKLALEKGLANTLVTSLSEIQSDIDKIFFTGDLKMEISNWSSFRGEGDYCTKWLSYYSCVNSVEAGLSAGKQLRSKIERAEVYGNNKESLLAEIDKHMELGSKRREKYLASGWLGYYNRRKTNVVEGLLPNTQYLSTECVREAKKFANALKNNPAEHEARSTEATYAKVANVCIFSANAAGGAK
jgi:hypothetical protein